MILTMDMKNDLFVLDDATLDALGRPKQVQLLINTQQRKLVLRACSAEDDEPIFLPDIFIPPNLFSYGNILFGSVRSRTASVCRFVAA